MSAVFPKCLRIAPSVDVGALTKGYIHIKGVTWEKAVPLSTNFDPYDADVYGSDTAPALQVQMDLEKGQTTETDIEVLNGFWADLYPYVGVSTQDSYDLTWRPPYGPILKVINVAKTSDANLKQKENALTACYPNSLGGLPYQASAVWKYHPANGGKITPTFIALNGTPLPADIRGGIYEGDVYFQVHGHGQAQDPANTLEFFFVPE
ncbi:hypothetical protein BKA70DRAFT_1424332 [Coprinopsis sp. MPI-PUGE-AT-0042]|nr:hypothetical protein BKA70DRAFT_1424332 [Coprinopsis sp. MPI-PUGE-AT-0042]